MRSVSATAHECRLPAVRSATIVDEGGAWAWLGPRRDTLYHMHMQVRLAAYAALSNRRLDCPKRGLIAGLPHAAGTLVQVFEIVFQRGNVEYFCFLVSP
jgi:hypothetical protein